VILELLPAIDSSTGSALLEISSLQVTYDRRAVAVDGVSLKVPSATIIALLGPNGAGKTTTLRACTGFLPSERAAVTGGEVRFLGATIVGKSPSDMVRAGLVLVPERDKVFNSLTVDENLRTVLTRPGGNRDEMREIVRELFPALRHRARLPAGFLSGGERQMLAIARALLADPLLLMVDELSLGIMPTLVSRLMESLASICRLRNIGVLLVEQNAAAALQIADHAHIMEAGRIVLEGRPDELLGNEAVRRSYLGVGVGGEVSSYADRRMRRRVQTYE
jgi:branched-chain amino acid transport system ATP-binding protein